MPVARRSSEGSLRERARLWGRARRAGATLRAPFRLPQAPADAPASRVVLGRDVYVGPSAWLTLNPPDGRLVIGEGTSIAAGFTVGIAGELRIGAGCVFSARVTVVDQEHDYRAWVLPARAEGHEPRMTWAMTEARPVSIGPGCWLGVGVTVLPGVTVGEGCVIGAGSVVNRDIPPYHVAAGAPARVLRAIE